MFARMTTQDLIETSEIVVIGRLEPPVRVQIATQTLRVNPITVLEAFKPGVAPPDPVFLWQPLDQAARSGADIVRPVGSQGLWFLRRINNAIPFLSADHPQRFVPSGRMTPVLAEVRTILKR